MCLEESWLMAFGTESVPGHLALPLGSTLLAHRSRSSASPALARQLRTAMRKYQSYALPGSILTDANNSGWAKLSNGYWVAMGFGKYITWYCMSAHDPFYDLD